MRPSCSRRFRQIPFDMSFVYNGTDFSDMVLPDTAFDFPNGGVSAFTVTGIDPNLRLDPTNPTAFCNRADVRGCRELHRHHDADYDPRAGVNYAARF